MTPRWCTWAGCRNPASALVDGWGMCQPHIREHDAQTAEEIRPPSTAPLDDAIRILWRKGRTDRQTAAEVGIFPEQVRARRRAMGLINAPPPPAACGTRAGHWRHKNRGEDVCGDCRKVERVYQRARGPRPAGRRTA